MKLPTSYYCYKKKVIKLDYNLIIINILIFKIKLSKMSILISLY